MGAVSRMYGPLDFDTLASDGPSDGPAGWESAPQSRFQFGPLTFLWAAAATTAIGILILFFGLNPAVQLGGYLFNGVASLVLLAMARRNAVTRSAKQGIAPPQSFYKSVLVLVVINAIAATGHAYMIALNYA